MYTFFRLQDCSQVDAGNSSLLMLFISTRTPSKTHHDLAIKSTRSAAYTAAQITPPKKPMHARPVIRRYLAKRVTGTRMRKNEVKQQQMAKMETSKNEGVTCREWPRIRVSKLRRPRRAAASHHRAEQVEVEESTCRLACAAPALCQLGQRRRRKQSTASRPRATDSIPASSSDERPCYCYDMHKLQRGLSQGPQTWLPTQLLSTMLWRLPLPSSSASAAPLQAKSRATRRAAAAEPLCRARRTQLSLAGDEVDNAIRCLRAHRQQRERQNARGNRSSAGERDGEG